MPGVAFVPIRFTPTYSVHQGEPCRGVSILLTDRNECRVVDIGLHLAETLYRLYPSNFDPGKMNRLLLDEATLDAIKAIKPLSHIHELWQKGLDQFRERRARYLIYE